MVVVMGKRTGLVLHSNMELPRNMMYYETLATPFVLLLPIISMFWVLCLLCLSHPPHTQQFSPACPLLCLSHPLFDHQIEHFRPFEARFNESQAACRALEQDLAALQALHDRAKEEIQSLRDGQVRHYLSQNRHQCECINIFHGNPVVITG